jgi:hypothetical protein
MVAASSWLLRCPGGLDAAAGALRPGGSLAVIGRSEQEAVDIATLIDTTASPRLTAGERKQAHDLVPRVGVAAAVRVLVCEYQLQERAFRGNFGRHASWVMTDDVNAGDRVHHVNAFGVGAGGVVGVAVVLARPLLDSREPHERSRVFQDGKVILKRQ